MLDEDIEIILVIAIVDFGRRREVGAHPTATSGFMVELEVDAAGTRFPDADNCAGIES